MANNFQQFMSETQARFCRRTRRINMIRIDRDRRVIAEPHDVIEYLDIENLDNDLYELQCSLYECYIDAVKRYLTAHHIRFVDNDAIDNPALDNDSYLSILAELYYHILRTRSDVSLATLLSMDKETLETAASIGVPITCEFTYVYDADRFWLFDKDWTK